MITENSSEDPSIVTTIEPTTEEPTTEVPTTIEPTTEEPTTEVPTTIEPTSEVPTTEEPTTEEPITEEPTTEEPITEEPTTEEPTTVEPTTEVPTTEEPTTEVPTTEEPSTEDNPVIVSFYTYSGSDVESIIGFPGELLSLPVPSFEGHIFAGWFYDETLTSPFSLNVIPDYDVTLYAKWDIQAYSISFRDHDDTVLYEEWYDYNTDLSALVIDDPNRVGYVFAGWDQSIPFTMPNNDVVIKATYTINQYTITFDSNEGTHVESITQDYDTEIMEPIEPTKEGYMFNGWYSDEAFTTEYNFTNMPAEDMTIYAKWTINQYAIQYVAYDGTVIQSTYFEYQETITNITPPSNPIRTGYTFVSWDGIIPQVMGSSNIIIKPVYLINQYIIQYLDYDGSIIQTTNVDYGTDLSSYVSPNQPTRIGYTFDKWDYSLPLTMPANPVTITATYTINHYSIIFDTCGGDLMDPITQEYGSTISPLQNPTKAGYDFVQWFLDENLLVPFSIDSMPSYDLVLYASWEEKVIEDDPSLYTFYLMADDTYEVRSYIGTSKVLIVPSSYQGKPVTSISNTAFRGLNTITSVTIPSSITYIGEAAFSGCGALTSITLPFIGQSQSATGKTALFGYIFGTMSYTGGYARAQYYASGLQTSYVIPTSLRTVTVTDADSLHYGAFYNCGNLTTINLPATLTSIGEMAFRGCNSLSNIHVQDENMSYSSEDGVLFNSKKTVLISYPVAKQETHYHIPYSVVSLEEDAFYSSTNLISITFPYGMTTIIVSAFRGCVNLSDFIVEEGNLNYLSENGIIFNRDKSIIVAYPVSKLETMYQIPSSVVSIGEYAFFGNKTLTSIIIPSSVLHIGDYALAGCQALTSISIPSNVQTIGNYSFSYCFNLTSVVFEEGSQITIIAAYAFSNSSHLTQVIIKTGSQITTIEHSAFARCYDLTTFIIEPENQLEIIGEKAFEECYSLTMISLENATNLLRVEKLAFSQCYELKGIVVPSSVQHIGSSAFYGCSKLESIVLPFVGESRTATESDALFGYIFGPNPFTGSVSTAQYYNSSSYTFFYLPHTLRIVVIDGATSIPYGAFSGCEWLTSITISSSTTSISQGALYGCKRLTSITLPFVGESKDATNDKALFGHVFGTISYSGSIPTIQYYDESSYTTYYLPEGLTTVTLLDATSLEYGAFYHCDTLENVHLPSTLISIGEKAFYQCTNLKTIVIPSYVTGIGYLAFSGCHSLTSVLFDSNSELSTIGNGAFSNCTALTSFIVPANVEIIEDYAFHGTSSLESIIVIESNLHYSSSDGILFDKDKTKIILYPSAKQDTSYQTPVTLTSIGDNAFYGNYFIEIVEISANVTSIGFGAFQGCVSLISISIPSNVMTIGDYAFNSCFSLNSVIIASASKLTSIGDDAFSGCNSLSNFTIPSGVKTIGDGAFSECRSFTIIDIPNSVESIGEGAFSYCTALENVIFQNGSQLKDLGSYVFSNCQSLKSITIPSGMTSIRTGTFYHCINLTSITFQTGSILTSIEDNAFYQCRELQTIAIPSSVVSIGSFAFYDCRLSSVNFGAGSQLSSIGLYAFYHCNLYDSITIPSSVTKIGTHAFGDNSIGLKIYTSLPSEPPGWDINWNPNNYQVIWNHNE